MDRPYNVAVPITKSDTVNFDGTTYSAAAVQAPKPCDALLIGGAGVVVAVMPNGQTVQWTALAGEIKELAAIRVNSTTTTATLMYALYRV